jgi:hypothetical protein
MLEDQIDMTQKLLDVFDTMMCVHNSITDEILLIVVPEPREQLRLRTLRGILPLNNMIPTIYCYIPRVLLSTCIAFLAKQCISV